MIPSNAHICGLVVVLQIMGSSGAEILKAKTPIHFVEEKLSVAEGLQQRLSARIPGEETLSPYAHSPLNSSPVRQRTTLLRLSPQPRKLSFAPDLDESDVNGISNSGPKISLGRVDDYDDDESNDADQFPSDADQEADSNRGKYQTPYIPSAQSESRESLELTTTYSPMTRVTLNPATTPTLDFERVSPTPEEISGKSSLNMSLESVIYSSIHSVSPKIVENGTFEKNDSNSTPLAESKSIGVEVVNETRTIEDSMDAQVSPPLQTFQVESMDQFVDGLFSLFLDDTKTQKSDTNTKKTELEPSSNLIPSTSLVLPQLKNILPTPESSFVSSLAIGGVLLSSILMLAAYFSLAFDDSLEQVSTSNSLVLPFAHGNNISPHPYHLKHPTFTVLNRKMDGKNKFGPVITPQFSPFIYRSPSFYPWRK